MAKSKKKKSKQQPGNHVPGRSLGSILGETGYFWPGIGALVLIPAALFFWWIMRSVVRFRMRGRASMTARLMAWAP